MSTLANTTWTITGNNVNFSIAYNADGTTTMTFPNGQSAAGNWAEAPDGSFMFQSPNSTNNKNINETFFGKHAGGTGSGYRCETNTVLHAFTTTKQ